VGEVFVQTELLKSVRLDVPLYPKLIQSLRDKGIPVKMAFTFEEAEQAFLEAFKGRS
jgi:cobalt/nickel transport system ATP-binding protein